MPLVSIIITSYNYRGFLLEDIETVLYSLDSNGALSSNAAENNDILRS